LGQSGTPPHYSFCLKAGETLFAWMNEWILTFNNGSSTMHKWMTPFKESTNLVLSAKHCITLWIKVGSGKVNVFDNLAIHTNRGLQSNYLVSMCCAWFILTFFLFFIIQFLDSFSRNSTCLEDFDFFIALIVITQCIVTHTNKIIESVKSHFCRTQDK